MVKFRCYCRLNALTWATLLLAVWMSVPHMSCLCSQTTVQAKQRVQCPMGCCSAGSNGCGCCCCQNIEDNDKKTDQIRGVCLKQTSKTIDATIAKSVSFCNMTSMSPMCTVVVSDADRRAIVFEPEFLNTGPPPDRIILFQHFLI